MDEMSLPVVDNSNVVESDPVYTGTVPERETPKAAPVVAEEVEDSEPADATEEVAEVAEVTAEVPEAPVVEDAVAPEAPDLQALIERANYKPEDVDMDIFDEYGNVDQAKLGVFMKENNERIFNKALEAADARAEARSIEDGNWAMINKEFPEIAKNPTYDKALRGARIQDLASGGDGDIVRLAKELVAPLREAKITAIEDTNRTIKKQEALETFVPNNAPVAKVELSNMEQLNAAIRDGNTERANQLRHAIRKERISGTTK